MKIGSPTIEDLLHAAREALWSSDPRENDGVLIHHVGPIDAGFIQGSLDLIESHSLRKSEPTVFRKRLFSVLVEGLENIHRHSSGAHNATAGLILAVDHNGYRMLLGNGMPRVMATMLAHRIELLNVMDDADLKDHFLKLLSNEGRTERGGAGLGLMTIARKSTRPLIFRSMDVDEHTVYGSLEVRIARPPQ